MNQPWSPPCPPPPGAPPSPEPPPFESMIETMRETIETQARTIRYLLTNYQMLLDKVEQEEDMEAAKTVNYTTTEQQTSRTWVDGKPIFQRTIQLLQPNLVTPYGNQSSSWAHGVTGIDTMVDVEFNFNTTQSFWDGTNINLFWGAQPPPTSGNAAWNVSEPGMTWAVDPLYITLPGTPPAGFWDGSNFVPPMVGTFKPPALFVTFRYTKQ